MKIKYDGPADIRILAAADLAKAGVEGFRKTEFFKGELTEVTSEVADALLGDADLFGTFSTEDTDTPLVIPEPTTEPAIVSKSTKAAPAVKSAP